MQVAPGQVEKDADGIWLSRTCKEHGTHRQRLSKHAEQYGNLHDFYFDLMTEPYQQRDYILRTTDRCNLDCPICLASANQRPLPDYPKDKLAKFLEGKKNFKIDLMGAEATLRKDLPELIEMIEGSGNRAALHTNGIALENEDYVKKVKAAGLREVHLQFDGFDDEAYKTLRGKPLLESKYKAIDNLTRNGMSVDLKVTIGKGINEAEQVKVLDFAAKRRNIKEVFFLTLRDLGAARGLEKTGLMVPDELIDNIEEQTGGRINRADVHVFQKMYFTFLHLFRVRKCLYNQHYLVRRTRDGGWVPMSEIVRMKGLEAKFDRYRTDVEKKGRMRAGSRLIASMIPHFFTRHGIGFAMDALVLKVLLYAGIDLSKMPSNNILLGFITACDPMLYDAGVSLNCGKGDLSLDQGRRPSGSIANVLRDRDIYMDDKAQTKGRVGQAAND